MKCGWAKINNKKIGIVASNGVIFSESAKKATQFIQLANKSNIPLLFIHNTTGFMVGKRYEQGGMINCGAQLIHAVAGSTVPHISLQVGNSYGAGNYAMCGKAYDPRLIVSWPTAEMAVMGGEQAAKVLLQIEKSSAKKQGFKFDKKEESELRKKIMDLSATCVFSEPQFEPKLVKTLVEGTGARTGVLDPLGASLTKGPELYSQLVREMANSLKRCLSAKS